MCVPAACRQSQGGGGSAPRRQGSYLAQANAAQAGKPFGPSHPPCQRICRGRGGSEQFRGTPRGSRFGESSAVPPRCRPRRSPSSRPRTPQCRRRRSAVAPCTPCGTLGARRGRSGQAAATADDQPLTERCTGPCAGRQVSSGMVTIHSARSDHSPVNRSYDPGVQHAAVRTVRTAEIPNRRAQSTAAWQTYLLFSDGSRRCRRSDRDRLTNHAPDGKFLHALTGT